METAICDTSSLIKLDKGGVLELLGKLFEKIYIPQGVMEEYRDETLIRKPFFEICMVQNILPVGMGKGERECISLAVELNIETFITDDIRAFRKAERLNLFPLTSERVLILAKRAKYIDSVKLVLDRMRAEGEGIDDEVYLKTLELAGETPELMEQISEDA
ncbi:MAG: hypothetical protein GY749_50785 [Desulfobacteraceae bacterium]|nr:hypothetical protein [Desulfobacteraceae bacterium]